MINRLVIFTFLDVVIRPNLVNEKSALLDDGGAHLFVGLALLLPDPDQLPLCLVDRPETVDQ